MEEQVRTINLHELLMHFFKKWWLFLILVVFFASTSYYYTISHVDKLYEASASIFIGKDFENELDLVVGDIQLDNILVDDYYYLVKTKKVTKQVVERLIEDQLSESYVDAEFIAKGVSVVDMGDSRFMELSFVDTNPVIAQKIVNNLAEVLAVEAVNVVGIENIQIVDYAEIPEYPISPNPIASSIGMGFFGILVGVGIIMVGLLPKNTIVSELASEDRLGLPVLGIIPKH